MQLYESICLSIGMGLHVRENVKVLWEYDMHIEPKSYIGMIMRPKVASIGNSYAYPT